MRKRIVAGNWKMNLLPNEAEALFNELIIKTDWPSHVQVIVFPPSIYISRFNELKDNHVLVGAQNFYPSKSGAFTGEISALHGRNGNVRAIFAQKGLPGQALGQKVQIL